MCVVAEHTRVAVDDTDGVLEDAFGPLVGVEVGSHEGAEVGERVVHAQAVGAVLSVDCEVAGAHDLNGVEVAALAFSHVEDEAGVVVGVEADERRVLVAFHVVDGESDSGVLHEFVEEVLHEEGLAATCFGDDDEVFRVHVVLAELVEDRVAGVHVAGDV